MPFTPSILEEHAHKYLINKKDVSSPFMTIGYDSLKKQNNQYRLAYTWEITVLDHSSLIKILIQNFGSL